MKKYNLFLVPGVVALFVIQSFAAMNFKLEAPKTDLVKDEQITICIYAWADVSEATGYNGLNGWQMSLTTSNDGVIEVVDGTVNFVAPSPYDTDITGYDSINSGSTGNINSLNLQTLTPQDSQTGIGDYDLIATFDIKAKDTGTVTYDMGGGSFYGFLRDFGDPSKDPFYFQQYDGNFDASNSDYIFNVTPEPSTLAILTVMSLSAIAKRRKK
jgi:hypothetical protein